MVENSVSRVPISIFIKLEGNIPLPVHGNTRKGQHLRPENIPLLTACAKVVKFHGIATSPVVLFVPLTSVSIFQEVVSLLLASRLKRLQSFTSSTLLNWTTGGACSLPAKSEREELLLWKRLTSYAKETLGVHKVGKRRKRMAILNYITVCLSIPEKLGTFKINFPEISVDEVHMDFIFGQETQSKCPVIK